MGNCSQCLSRGKEEEGKSSLLIGEGKAGKVELGTGVDEKPAGEINPAELQHLKLHENAWREASTTPRPKDPAPEQSPGVAFKVGDIVKLTALKNRPDLNGKKVEVLRVDPEKPGRLIVGLKGSASDSQLAIKPENLRPIVDLMSEDSRAELQACLDLLGIAAE